MKAHFLLFILSIFLFFPVTLSAVTPTVSLSETPVPPDTATPSATLSPEPTSTATAAATLKTGDATVHVQETNIINLNTEGTDTCVLVISEFEPAEGIRDFTTQCESIEVIASEEVTQDLITHENETVLYTELEAIAATGSNVSIIPDTALETGDATARIDVFNLVNTNLTGDRTFFGVINLFSKREGDIIVPYEFDFLDPDIIPTSSPSAFINRNTNDATVETHIKADATTGNNTITEDATITTGNAEIDIKVQDKVNTTIIGNQFRMVEVNTLGTWNGRIEQFLPSFSPPTEVISTNAASVITNLTLSADTGSNTLLKGGSIKTGDAMAKAHVFNFINTSITGNNWYHLVINIFDTFDGNIIFPRTELALTSDKSKTEVKEGEEFTYTINFENKGVLNAKDTIVTAELPDIIEVIESNGGITESGIWKWQLGDVTASSIGSLSFRARAKQAATGARGRFTISSPLLDANSDNNTSIFEFIVTLFEKKKDTESTNEQEHVQEYVTHLTEDSSLLSSMPMPSPITEMTASVGLIHQQQPIENGTNEDVRAEVTGQPQSQTAGTVTSLNFLLMYLMGIGIWMMRQIFE